MTQVETEPLIYTADQASQRLGLRGDGKPIKTARWLLDEARAGRIPCTRLGKTPCFSEQNLRDLIAGNFCDPSDYGRKARSRRR